MLWKRRSSQLSSEVVCYERVQPQVRNREEAAREKVEKRIKFLKYLSRTNELRRSSIRHLLMRCRACSIPVIAKVEELEGCTTVISKNNKDGEVASGSIGSCGEVCVFLSGWAQMRYLFHHFKQASLTPCRYHIFRKLVTLLQKSAHK